MKVNRNIFFLVIVFFIPAIAFSSVALSENEEEALRLCIKGYVLNAPVNLEEIEPGKEQYLAIGKYGATFLGLENKVSDEFLLKLVDEEMTLFFMNFSQEYLMPTKDPLEKKVARGWGDTPGADPTPNSEAEVPFFSLPLLIEDKKNIRQLLTTMANKNIVQLFLDMKSMNKVGDKVRRVHPLRFMGFILADPHLKKCLRMIEEDSIKWSNFMDGYEESMRREAQNEQIVVYLPGFAQLLKVEENEIESFIENEDYYGLVKFFLRR